MKSVKLPTAKGGEWGVLVHDLVLEEGSKRHFTVPDVYDEITEFVAERDPRTIAVNTSAPPRGGVGVDVRSIPVTVPGFGNSRPGWGFDPARFFFFYFP